MKRALLIAAAAAALALAGCGRGYETTKPVDGYVVDFSGVGGFAYINVWRDPVTGCEHYVTDDGFMSPRLYPDGTQKCAPPTPATPAP